MTTRRTPVTPRQVEAFKGVMDTGMVTAAARRMNLSQPAVSKLLAHFEEAVGLALFSREKKRLVPTAEAGLLLREVDRVYAGLHEIETKAEALRGLRAGELTIASISAFGHEHVPQRVASFLQSHDGANIGLYVTSAGNVAEWAIGQKIDLGITFGAVEHPSVVSELLCQRTAVCVLPRNHRLARKRAVVPADLAGENFVSFAADSGIRHQIDTVFQRAGVVRRLGVTAFVSSSACSLVANGFGVSIVEPFTAEEFASRGQLVVKPFKPEITYDFHLLFPRFRPRSLLLQKFAAEFAAFVRSAKLR